MGKPNAMLAKLQSQAETKARAQYNSMLEIHSEIDLMAHMLSVHEDLEVGPGRAERALNGFLESKMEIAQMVTDECTEDTQGEFCKTQRDLARALKEIFGASLWEKYKVLFPMLKDYWDLV